MLTRLDFREPEGTVLYTAICHSQLEAEFLIGRIMQYDWFDEKGTYTMTWTDLTSLEERVLHVYRFKLEPPHARAAFESFNNEQQQ
ncbi:hypothetical protein [Chitinophaga sp. Cy-1792]|uniref:hypothetical protein n=1 Tax=Chitinophaga sp. Cy-1792 TaxID=2608339 RepID=UPI00141FFCA3|nr:hypothetical protein [Chitinophaga sp. Cy-1792]NIG54445.1 hypothetical protein [Chitinophaga sp. Cy-1792]